MTDQSIMGFIEIIYMFNQLIKLFEVVARKIKL